MADMNFERFEGSRRASNRPANIRNPKPRTTEPRNFQPMVNLAGAVTSVALVLGLAVWGYKLAVRDVSGIPVIRALQGPMRVAPAVPGGSVADNQGLAVNAIAAEGNAAAPADRLVLAPAAIELSLDDEPGLTSNAPTVAADQVDALLTNQTTAAPASPNDAASETANETAIDQALAAALSEGGEISPASVTPEQQTGATDVSGVVVRSPRPLARPGSFAAGSGAPAGEIGTVEDVISVASPEMQPSDVEIGTRLVQLGAFDTADGARAEWTKLQGSFGDLMAGKAIIVQPATSGGQTFYRLRAFGFSDEDDSRRFCSALLSEDTACIPVTQR